MSRGLSIVKFTVPILDEEDAHDDCVCVACASGPSATRYRVEGSTGPVSMASGPLYVERREE